MNNGESVLQKNRKSIYVGIDLGTTNSVATTFDGTDTTVIRNGHGHVLTPSIVRIDARGNVLVGSRARRYLDSDSANTRSEFKRLMGTSNVLEFPASGLERRPEELSAEILKSIRSDIADQTGVTPDYAVISVPALFELHQTAATSEAARMAGFKRIELIQEPVASAIAAGWSQESADGPWLVYDLGGGTFDVSLLDTREGLLRIVGHDGDNFLGGRDFDRALTDLILRKLATDGVVIDPANAEHALALRRLRFAAEEAKIELTRANDTTIFISNLEVDGEDVEVDLLVTRTEYESLILPLIDRSIAICKRLLTANGLGEGGLKRLVLVGGPTVTPLLRTRVRDVLNVEFGEGLDPMTLVAQGAALFAGTVGLDGHPEIKSDKPIDSTAPKVWLQFPAVTSDLTPFVVGKLLDNVSSVTHIRLERADGQWQSEPSPCDESGTFSMMVSLLPRQSTTFNLYGILTNGDSIQLQPPSFSISHGITLGEPPLARTIAVALANNSVLTYFERGAPLPIRRTFILRTAETVHPEDKGYALKVPIIQGEFSLAHLCRLVGTLEIPSAALHASLPVASEIELTLELDRGGQLGASARIVKTNQVFDQVALLVTPQISLGEIDTALTKLQSRVDGILRTSFLNRSSADVARISELRQRLEDVRRNAIAFHGGDLDAGEQARRGITDFDGALADLEADKAWPELMQRLDQRFEWALSWIAAFGSEIEKATLTKAYHAGKQAITSKFEHEVERQIGLISQLGSAAYFRNPSAWEGEFNAIASKVSESIDLQRATTLVNQGRSALAQNNMEELQHVVRELWKLAPVDGKAQKLGHGSGLIYN
ncbi:MAG: Hsp70 family protein [Gammaproteobacteria bacterium]|nr:Hsp70 family protein [Gammaproteobacteria bacterium]